MFNSSIVHFFPSLAGIELLPKIFCQPDCQINYIISTDIDSLAEVYDQLREKSSKGEQNMIAHFIWIGQHAEHQHWEKVARIVHSLFMDKEDKVQVVHVKKTVFHDE